MKTISKLRTAFFNVRTIGFGTVILATALGAAVASDGTYSQVAFSPSSDDTLVVLKASQLRLISERLGANTLVFPAGLKAAAERQGLDHVLDNEQAQFENNVTARQEKDQAIQLRKQALESRIANAEVQLQLAKATKLNSVTTLRNNSDVRKRGIAGQNVRRITVELATLKHQHEQLRRTEAYRLVVTNATLSKALDDVRTQLVERT